VKSKHFKELALILSQLRPAAETPVPTREYVLWETLANGIADALERLAPRECRFDRIKWNEAIYGHVTDAKGVSK
jgi:hypothetical protein